MPLTDSGIHFEHWEDTVDAHPLDCHTHPLDCHTHPLTLINGFARSMSDFRSFARSLQRKLNIGIVMIDNRTTGKTTAEAPFTLNTLADDVIAVWDHLGLERATVLGISMGGAIATTLALQHRQRVARLVLVSSFTHRTHANNYDTNELEQVMARIINSVAPCFYAKNKILMHALAKKTAKEICAGTHSPQSQALKHYDIRNRLTDIRCPTLIIHGDEDNIVPKDEAARLAAGIAGAKLTVFAKAGHMLLMEKHSEMLMEVVSFIKN